MNWTRSMQLFNMTLGVLLGLLTYGFLNFDQKWEAGPGLVSTIVGAIIVLCVHVISKFLDRKIGWKKNTGLRLFAGTAISTFLAILIVRLIFFELESSHFIKIIILIFTYSILYNIIYFIFFSYYEFVRGHIQQQEFETRQTQLQLDALKSQLSPHFLFNSLNALSALFHKDLQSAERFIRSLGNSYKYVLEQYKHPLVTVKKELDFATSYFEMMQIRFGKNLELSIDIESNLLSGRIPPLSLQMLVENAVKHNRIDSDSPLTINISSSNGYLKVSNNKILKSSSLSSTKVGLKNISDRFELLNSKTIEVEESDLFTVQIPIIR